MASAAPPSHLMEAILCPICKDPMENPVSVDCGHSFCRACIEKHFVRRTEMGCVEEMLCPACQTKIIKENTRPNWQLKSVIENLQSQSTGQGDLCATHKEKRLWFCKEDKELLCLSCKMAAKHTSHSVLPLKEAAPMYKGEIMNYQKILTEKKQEVLSNKVKTEKERKGLLEQVKMEKKKTESAFRQLRQVIEEQERLLLSRMERIMEEIKKESENDLDKQEVEHSLERIIQEVEEKLHQPALDFLQDIKSFMERCEVWTDSEISPITFPAALKLKIWDFRDINAFLEGIVNSFQDSLITGLQLQKVNVRFDRETANPRLVVSPDCKILRWVETPQDVPDNPERFDRWCYALGCEEFSAGRHFWEVFVGSVEIWSVGVARKTVKRKGDVIMNAEEGIWCMGKWKGAYQCTYMDQPLSLSEEPRKIRVTLNCEGCRLAFYDAERGTLICELPRGSFTTEKLCPFFACFFCQLSIAS